jgi:hypothetical protein
MFNNVNPMFSMFLCGSNFNGTHKLFLSPNIFHVELLLNSINIVG